MSESSSYSGSDSESSVDIEDIEDDLYAIASERKKLEETPTVNDEAGLKQKLAEIKLRIKGYEPDAIPWSEVMVITSDKVVQQILDDADDDLKRERVFYDLTVAAIEKGFQNLSDEGIPYERPTDYYAEMQKSDEHMKKIKGILLKEKREIEEATERRKNRTSKKFAKQVQIQSKQKRKAEKDAELDAVKQWRKNNKGSGEDFPEELLDPKSQQRKGARSISKATIKAQRYGFGGKKSGSKRNTSDSASDFSAFNKTHNKTADPAFRRGGAGSGRGGKGGPSGAASRPGKRKRQQSTGGPAKKARR
eukprot:TRINITY_DN3132_c0_g3_i1.p1 TRINITY_DN3132_c0_g3~~TRINITY_DN3132_c0_g3_i1.p1  ORF type:complete len:318 (-),score=86.07 TRINITY_DN3132_c0_g3_i1:93-1010(-)